MLPRSQNFYFIVPTFRRGNAARDALRPAPLERHRIHSHARAWERCYCLLSFAIHYHIDTKQPIKRLMYLVNPGFFQRGK